MKLPPASFNTLLSPVVAMAPRAFFAFFAFFAFCCVSAHGQTNGLATQRANAVEDKRVEKQMWTQPRSNSLMNKRFPIEQWDKHFSSVGSKRAPIQLKEGKEKAIFETKRLDRKEVDFEMSRWNQQMAGLHKKAGIEMDDQAQLVADRRLYKMMTQDAERFSDLEQKLSLRDLNRYQFRRNRLDGDIPVERAGADQ